MKLFVSIPMTGIEDTVIARFNRAKALIESDPVLSQYEIVTPYRMLEVFDEHGLVEGIKNDNKTTGYAMGKNVQIVIGCDAIYSCDGWRNSKGCKVERYTAEVYGLKLFEEDEVPIMTTGKVDGKEVAMSTDKSSATKAPPAYECGDEQPALSQGEALYSLLSTTTTPVFARKHCDIYAYAKILRDNLENSGAWQTFRDNGFRSQPYGAHIRGMLSGYKNLIAVLRHMQGHNDIDGLLDMLSALDLDNEESILKELVDLSKEIDSLTLGK